MAFLVTNYGTPFYFIASHTATEANYSAPVSVSKLQHNHQPHKNFRFFNSPGANSSYLSLRNLIETQQMKPGMVFFLTRGDVYPEIIEKSNL